MAFHANLTASEIGLFQSLVLAPVLIFTLAGGLISDRIGARYSFALSTAAFSALLVCFGLFNSLIGFSFWLFAIYCILAGVFSAISNPSADSMIPDSAPLSTRDNTMRAANVHNQAKLIGNISGFALPVLSSLGGFLFNGVLMAVSVCFVLRHQNIQSSTPVTAAPDLNGNRQNKLARVIAHFRTCNENFEILLSSALIGLFVIPISFVVWPLLIRERFSEYSDLYAMIWVVFWIGATVSTKFFQSRLTQIQRPGRIAFVLWSGFVITMTTLAFSNSFIAMCFSIFVFGICNAGKPLVYGKYLDNCPQKDRGLLIGADQTAYWGLATVGTFFLGSLVDQVGVKVALLVYAAGLASCMIALIFQGNIIRLRSTPID